MIDIHRRGKKIKTLSTANFIKTWTWSGDMLYTSTVSGVFLSSCAQHTQNIPEYHYQQLEVQWIITAASTTDYKRPAEQIIEARLKSSWCKNWLCRPFVEANILQTRSRKTWKMPSLPENQINHKRTKIQVEKCASEFSEMTPNTMQCENGCSRKIRPTEESESDKGDNLQNF